MPRFDFRSPGAAAAQAIQELLLQRRQEERQAMLDKLNADNMQHGWKTADAQVAIAERGAATAEGHLGVSKEAEARAARQGQDEIESRQFGEIAEDTPIESLSEVLQKRAEAAGRVKTLPPVTPYTTTATTYSPIPKMGPLSDDELAQEALTSAQDVSAPEQAGPEIPGSRVFIGDADYRKTQRQEDALKSYLQAHPEMQTENPELFSVLSMRAGGVDITPPPSLLEPPPSASLFGPTDRGLKKLPRGGEAHVQGYEPRLPAAALPQMYQVYDAEGNFKGSDNFSLEEKDKFQLDHPGWALRGVNYKPEAPTPIVDKTLYTNLVNAYRIPARNRREEAVAAAHAAIRAQASERASAEVVDAVEQGLADLAKYDAAGRARPPMETFMKSFEGYSPTELQQIRSLLESLSQLPQ